MILIDVDDDAGALKEDADVSMVVFCLVKFIAVTFGLLNVHFHSRKFASCIYPLGN